MSRLALRSAALGYLGLLLLLPVGMVFWRTFEDGLEPVWEALTRAAFTHALWLSVVITLIAVPANTEHRTASPPFDKFTRGFCRLPGRLRRLGSLLHAKSLAHRVSR